MFFSYFFVLFRRLPLRLLPALRRVGGLASVCSSALLAALEGNRFRFRKIKFLRIVRFSPELSGGELFEQQRKILYFANS